MKGSKILWIDNTPSHIEEAAELLRDEGFQVETVGTAGAGAAAIAQAPDAYLAVIIDLLLPAEAITVPNTNGPELLEPLPGQHGGITLGRWLQRRWPNLNILGVSVKTDRKDPQVRWFKETAEGYLDKLTLYQTPRALLLRIKNLQPGEARPAKPSLSTYLIHGSNEAAKDEFLRYLTGTLRIPSPIVLHDQPDQGISTLLRAVADRDDRKLVFVLLPADATERQAVLFEAGCLYGTCVGKKGKTIFLHHGEAGIASKLPDLSTVDISGGIMKADGTIRALVNDYLPLLRRR
ncbi:MAG: hypothetical protein OEV73_03740 [Desulfobulbaceae bacterium]|nr:hypothetical protein [Desulfobulbaceae bacterium]